MASGEGKKKMITLRSSDNVEFEVEAAVAMESQTIRRMIEDNCADNSIPIPNINSKLLSIVIEYCTKHVHTTKLEDAAAPAPANTAISGEDLKKWDAELVKIDHATLIDLIEAANFLEIKGLLDLTCQAMADMIKGKSPEEIRKTFNIMNDLSPEEEEEIIWDIQWALEFQWALE